MVALMKGRSILSLLELNSQEVRKVLDLAIILKKETKQGILRPMLKGKVLATIFQKPSTRTRVSFDVAMLQLGGHALNLSVSELQLGRGETIEDTAKTLSRYVDAIMARVYDHNDIVRLAKASSVPIINGLSNSYHPAQILADLQTLLEVKGRLRGLKVAWVGDGNNVCNTWLIGASLMGIDISIATPLKYRPLKESMDNALRIAKEKGSKIEVTDDPEIAVNDADCVITDSMVSMGLDEEREERLRIFLPKYRVDEELMDKADPNAIFMHCLPAKRGEEVVAEIIDGPRSVVWDEAENRLHSQKALLCYLLLDEEEILR
ncbi:MAG: ornithine carbamoyltransferase [Candidatus Methylarchaceae archaeon HK02M1]|nr:ornithine carbamoyltransferase [Candidatus Methylarchaceae archaeon HK02M1]